MTRCLSKMTTIVFYVLLAFLFLPNNASTKKLEPHNTIICDLKKSEIVYIMKFLTLREALGLKFASKLLEAVIPKITQENVKYLKPFLNYGYEVGFVLSRYCSTLNNDSEELREINENIFEMAEWEIYFNSYAFVLDLNQNLVLFGGIGEYEEKTPTKCMHGPLYTTEMNKRAIFGLGQTVHGPQFFTVGDPNFCTNDVPEKVQQECLEILDCLPMCTTSFCSVLNIYTHKLFSWPWGDFYAENEIPPPKEILENVSMLVEQNNEAISIVFLDGSVAAWGNSMFGGKIPENIKHLLKNIYDIKKTEGAFAAISHDNKVYAWGHPLFGGEIPEDIQPLLQNIKSVGTTKKAFAARTFDGKVFAWGDPNYGGNVPEGIQPLLQNINRVVSNKGAFAALKRDGNLFTWGDPNCGGSPSKETQAQLCNVRCICLTDYGQFAAFFNDDRDPLKWPSMTRKLSLVTMEEKQMNVKLFE